MWRRLLLSSHAVLPSSKALFLLLATHVSRRNRFQSNAASLCGWSAGCPVESQAGVLKVRSKLCAQTGARLSAVYRRRQFLECFTLVA